MKKFFDACEQTVPTCWIQHVGTVCSRLYFSHDHEIEESLDKLRDLSLFSTHGDEIQSLTLKLEALLDKERLQNLQQRPVTDYFLKL